MLTALRPLKRHALRRILTEPKNALIRQYTKLFAMDGIALTFESEALDLVVDHAVEPKTRRARIAWHVRSHLEQRHV